MNPDSLLLVAVVTLGVLAALGAVAYYLRLRRPTEFRLPDGAVYIRTSSEPSASSDDSGRIMLVLVGTFAANVGGALLALLARTGLDGCIGSILLLEMDTARRNKFLRSIPPVFHDRVVSASFSGLAGGLGGRSPEEVDQLIDRWGPSVQNGARQACARHQQRGAGDEAALVLVFVSQGGQAIIGVKAVETIARIFRTAQFYGFTAIPIDDQLRRRFDTVLRRYRGAGVSSFVVSDNLGDEVRNDYGMIASVVGLVAAATGADAALEANNAWRLLVGETPPDGCISYSIDVTSLPGYLVSPHSRGPALYYTQKSSVHSAFLSLLEGLDRMECQALQSDSADNLGPDGPCIEIILAGISPPDLRSLEDDIVLAQSLRGKPKRNRHLLFASIAVDVDPERPLCPVAAVSLRPFRRHGASDVLPESQKPPLPPIAESRAENGAAHMAGTVERG